MARRLPRLEQELAKHHISTSKSFQDLEKELRDFSCDIERKIEGYEAQVIDDDDPSGLFHKEG